MVKNSWLSSQQHNDDEQDKTRDHCVEQRFQNVAYHVISLVK
jgi:hypothetical protein